jgi:pilus assembly protein CpaE
MTTRVLIADSDSITATWLKSVLEREGCAVDMAHTAQAAMEKIALDLPDFVVMEVALPDDDGLEVIRHLRMDPETHKIHIIILSSRSRPEDIVTGMNAGANEYIIKRPGADVELIGKIRVLLAQPQVPTPEIAAPARGRIFSFCSAKGGTGTTSVCVNTAYALARLDPDAEILVVDMIFPMGTVGLSLGFESAQTVVALTRQPTLDRNTVARYVSSRTRWGFRLLLGANDPREAADLDVNKVVPLFELLKAEYDYVLVDFGRALSRISLPIIEMSEGIIVIVSPDISTVKGTKTILRYFQSRGLSLDRLVVINNRTVGRVWTTTDDIERELNVKLKATVPYTVEYMTMAINAAVPFMERFPENAACSTFNDIARLIQAYAGRKPD